LIKDYGFSIARERYDPNMMGNAQVIFESTLIGIDIVLDRSQVLIAIGSLAKPRREWFEFSDVLHYFTPDLTAYIFPNVPKDFPNYESSVDAQVSRLAKLMSQYCAPILNGDLSIANKVKEIESKRVSEMLESLQRRKP
jgi:hypothetical protein